MLFLAIQAPGFWLAPMLPQRERVQSYLTRGPQTTGVMEYPHQSHRATSLRSRLVSEPMVLLLFKTTIAVCQRRRMGFILLPKATL